MRISVGRIRTSQAGVTEWKMGFRFFRQVKVAPGVRVNLSLGGPSLRFGPGGIGVTAGKRGVRASAGIPGTGLYVTEKIGPQGGSRRKPARKRDQQAPGKPEASITLGFFEHIRAKPVKLALVDGLKALVSGEESRALEHFRNATTYADGAFLAGFLALKSGHPSEAQDHLIKVVPLSDDLGKQVSRFGITAQVPFPVTSEITALIGMDITGWMLLSIEAYQANQRPADGACCAARIHAHFPDNPVVLLSLVELLFQLASQGDAECLKAAGVAREFSTYIRKTREDERRAISQLEKTLGEGSDATLKRIVDLTQEVENESHVHGGVLLYRARAFRRLGLPVLARQTMTNTLRRRKGRPEELLLALRYERALAYADYGQRARSKSDMSIIYSVDPTYEDVADRLGLNP